MKFYILIVRNKLSYPTQDDTDKFVAWIKKYTPLEPQVDYLDLDLEVKHKIFVYLQNKFFWGLDGI